MKEKQVPNFDSQIELIMYQQVPQKEAYLIRVNQYAPNWNEHENWQIIGGIFSGSDDETIRVWKLLKNSWTSLNPFKRHKVYYLLLNSKEDQLFSGGSDNQIIVIKQKQILCTLNDLNQSEIFLVSCSILKIEIIVWENGQNNKMKFKQQFVINQCLNSFTYQQSQSQHYPGRYLLFLSENHFIWVTVTKEADILFVFERKNGRFQENSQLTIKIKLRKRKQRYITISIYQRQGNIANYCKTQTSYIFLKRFWLGKAQNDLTIELPYNKHLWNNDEQFVISIILVKQNTRLLSV
ncbi:unnamed protein product [Paramecium octaurelia]|uniref:Uncharacterized protein n=1 Tax=Paramecium octaurelia TaxID=43137 RepID=A0A8S1XQZ0_PAROT|nr:unnamed protein product [Paramecium octaurelia]